ncbi:hypothetical protein RvY_15060-3 [Ramazzottius varieornatus]|uniref:Dynein heavy chain ATP-binding dynein motor region domain-containing protein n=1 Tax=Ramazzottius varieornatus TaxID=947166 RepID=A0A1D1W0K8_RAMVA|nr:hypothetical protein RvY_15060-3 [Ramazzottius varieornatus]
MLQASFQQLTEEAAVMKIELNRLSERLKVAQVVVEKLEDEYTRWSTQLKETSLSEQQLQLNALLAAGFITYLAACSEDERKAVMGRWTERFKVESFDLVNLMTTESTRLQWRADGLSADTLSMENAVILQYTDAPPLIIDPATSITNWMKTFLKSTTVETVDQEDTNFQSILEHSVRFGKTLIVEVADKIDPVLVPLLRRDMAKQGARLQTEIGEKLLDFHPQFRLLLTTRNSNLPIHPQTASLLNVISFTPTRAGLANQLLSIVIECKLPEVERQRKELLKAQEDLKIKLTALEDSLLNELANSQGNILENVELQESLNKTKSSSLVIEKNLEESRIVKETLDKDQAVFAILANKCCAVYFALRDLHQLNPLYRFGLPMFLKLYQKAVENLAKDDHVKNQLQKFCAVAFYQVIHYVYAHMSRSIFKRDRLTSLLQFVRMVRPELLTEGEWSFFLNSKAISKPSSTSFPWLDPDQQAGLGHLLQAVPDLRSALQLNDESVWKVFIKHPQCETAFPTTLKLTPFQQALVVSVLRPDRLISALSLFLAKSLKLADLSVDTSLIGLLEDSNAQTPILIVTAGGTDPSVDLRELATERAPGKSIQMFAMGQRDVESAVTAIRSAAENGTWLCLENLHLVPTFFQRLSKAVRGIQPAQTFRLWMTTESADSVPVPLLEATLKCVYEGKHWCSVSRCLTEPADDSVTVQSFAAPPAVKHNLQLTLKESSESIRQTISSCPSSQRFQLLLLWVHAVLQERRNFVPRGWTKFYEFNASDLRSAMRVVAKFSQSSFSSETHIRGLLTDVVYGGRVDLEVDLRVLISYVQAFFGHSIDGRLFGQGGMPSMSSLAAFIEYVKQMPEREAPEVLGLPANIDGALQKSDSNRVMTDLKGLQRASVEKASTVNGGTDRLVEIASVLLKKWASYAAEDTLQRQSSNSLVEFFQQEIAFGAIFVKAAHGDVTAAINSKDEATTTRADSLDTSSELKLGETPSKWLSVWEVGPLDPATFLKAIDDKLAYCLTMVSQAQKSLPGLRVEMGRMFHPQTMTGILRHLAARSSNQPLEQLVFRNEWSLTAIKSIPYTVSLVGLRLEGALFDGTTLKECLYDSPSSVSAPACYVAWVSQGASGDASVNGNTVAVPVFCTASRADLAFHLSVPCDSDPEKWVRAGVAFVLDI